MLPITLLSFVFKHLLGDLDLVQGSVLLAPSDPADMGQVAGRAAAVQVVHASHLPCISINRSPRVLGPVAAVAVTGLIPGIKVTVESAR